MKDTITKFLGKLPQRWVVTVMSMLGVTAAFTMRGCMCITLTQMVVPMKTSFVQTEGICSVPETVQEQLQRLTSNRSSPEGFDHDDSGGDSGGDANGRFAWDEETQGMILSSFYYGYILTHIPGGLLAQTFGGKFTMAYAILSTSTLTLLTPTVARMGSATYLMVLRFIEGLGEGIAFPALCSLLAVWAPPHEKGKLSTLVFSGVPIGNICSNLFSGYIIAYMPGGWPNVFYCFGIMGFVWLAVWLSIVYSNPLSHPYISAEECKYLHETIGSIERKRDLPSTPWKKILLSPAVWALIVGEIGFDWGAYTVINDLPKYMNDVLHFSVKQNGFLSSAPFLAQWIMSILSGIFSDYMAERKFLKITKIRKIYAFIGTIGPGLGVMCASFVGCDKFVATLCFTLGMALMGFIYPSIRINALDLSPNYSASLMALVNGLGSLSGMASPIVLGYLTPNRTVFEWRLVFWIMLIIMTVSSTVFGIFGSAELQSWDDGESSPRGTPITQKKSNEKIRQ